MPGLTPEERLSALTVSLNTDTSLVPNNSLEEFSFPLTVRVAGEMSFARLNLAFVNALSYCHLH